MKNANLSSLIVFLLFLTTSLTAQSPECKISEFLSPVSQGQLSTDDPPVPCGFTTSDGIYVNQCSSCGMKIADDNCVDTPISSLCALDGFETSSAGYTNDVFAPTLGFCGGGTGTNSNSWIGFTAQTNFIELLIIASNCTDDGTSIFPGIQIAIAETDCQNNYSALACFGSVGQGALLNDTAIISTSELIPGNEYYILIDGFDGGMCDLRLEVLDGFGEPEFDILVNNPGQLCPDVLNPGEFTSQIGSGANIDVEVGGSASTDLTFYWCNANDDVIATTSGQVITPNFVRGSLDGSFFNNTDGFTVKIVDNGSCCPQCAEVELAITNLLPTAAAIVVGPNGIEELNCNNDSILIAGGPEDGSTPAVELWQIVDAWGQRRQLDINLVLQDGRLDEFTISRDIIEMYFPGQLLGEVDIVYGFLESFTQLCFNEAAVQVAFDFREPEDLTITGGTLSCGQSEVVLTASTSSTGNFEYCWTDGGLNTYPNGPTLTVNSGGAYILTVKNLDNGCQTSDTITIEVDQDAPNIIPVLVNGQVGPLNCNNPIQIYEGQLLSPGSNVSIEWIDPNGNLIPGNTVTIDEFSVQGVYTLTAFDNSNNCFSTSTISPLWDFESPGIELSSTGTIFCAPNDEVTLLAIDPTPFSNTSFSWTDPAGNLLSNGLSNPIVSEGGLYTSVAVGQNGCTAVEQLLVEINNNSPVVSVGPDFELTCSAGADSYELSGTGMAANGADPLTFSWSLNGAEFSTSPNVLVTEPGNYILTVTNVINNCMATEMVQVTDNRMDPFVVANAQSELDCNTQTVLLEGDSDDPLAEYIWTSAAGTVLVGQSVDVSEEGLWELVVTSANGCQGSTSVIVEGDFDTPENVIITGGNELNCQINSVQLFGSTTTSNVSYAWTLNGDGNIISVEQNPFFGAAGLYTLTVTGSNGCTTSIDYEVASDESLPSSEAVVSGEINCINSTVMLQGSSSLGNSEYCWTGPPGFAPLNTQDIEVSTPGTYRLTVKDLDNQCNSFIDVTVLENRMDPNVVVEGDLLSCNQGMEHRVIATTSVTNATYLWIGPNGFSSGEANPIISDAGEYTVTVTNSDNGCFTTTSVIIEEVEEVTFEQIALNATCFGEDNASIQINVLTGTPPYNVSGDLDNLSNNNLAPGIYFVNVEDVNGCSTSTEIVITEPEELLLGQTATNDVLEVMASGGLAPYTYAWNDGSTGPIIAAPAAGFNYEVIVTDANGCTTVLNSVIFDDSELCDVFELLPSLVPGEMSNDNPAVPCGFENGPLYINECSPCGNKIADNACLNTPISSLCAIDGFESTTAGSVPDPSAPSLVICGAEASSENKMWIGFTAQTNILELLITTSDCTTQGNTNPIQVAIVETNCENQLNALDCSSNTNQGNLLNTSVILRTDALIPGNPYYILIDESEASACEIRLDVLDGIGVPEYDFLVNEPGQFCPDVLNPGVFNTSATVDVMVGGIATTDLTYFWLSPAGEVIATTQGEEVSANVVRGMLDGSFFVEAGVYTVQIIDNGSCCPLCTELDFEIVDPSQAMASIVDTGSSGSELSCDNEAVLLEGGPIDGSIPAVEQWQIEDANGERQQLGISIVSSEGRLNEFVITQELVSEYFPGQNNGEARIVYSFLSDIEGTCFSEAFVALSFDFSSVSISIAEPGILTCEDGASVLLDASNSQTTGGNTSFLWTSIDGFPITGADTNQAEVSDAGVYTLLVTDMDSGCSLTSTIEVIAAEDVTFEENVQSVTCFGDADGSVEFVILTGTAPFTITGALSDLTTDNLAPGIYTVSIEDANSCVSATEIVITEPDQLVLSQDGPPTNGILEVVATGGTPEYIYLWNDGTMGNTISEAVSGFAYEVTVTDANGCIDSLNMVLTNTAELTIDRNDVSLFPNPNEGLFQFLFDPSLELDEILIYNIYGQIVHQMKNETSRSRIDFSLPDLSQGTYLFEARFEQGVHRQKMILF